MLIMWDYFSEQYLVISFWVKCVVKAGVELQNYAFTYQSSSYSLSITSLQRLKSIHNTLLRTKILLIIYFISCLLLQFDNRLVKLNHHFRLTACSVKDSLVQFPVNQSLCSFLSNTIFFLKFCIFSEDYIFLLPQTVKVH